MELGASADIWLNHRQRPLALPQKGLARRSPEVPSFNSNACLLLAGTFKLMMLPCAALACLQGRLLKRGLSSVTCSQQADTCSTRNMLPAHNPSWFMPHCLFPVPQLHASAVLSVRHDDCRAYSSSSGHRAQHDSSANLTPLAMLLNIPTSADPSVMCMMRVGCCCLPAGPAPPA